MNFEGKHEVIYHNAFCFLKMINSPFGENSSYGSEYKIKETNVERKKNV